MFLGAQQSCTKDIYTFLLLSALLSVLAKKINKLKKNKDLLLQQSHAYHKVNARNLFYENFGVLLFQASSPLSTFEE